ncbi:MAG: hypothetical protein KZQ68_16940, partial [gamma proteobacterium symbiont of Bathyaustriella thionipta]|nr:hypothetical protein [gamma proteobacterium symbiont of Bathyaustriella thionipta]
ENLRKFFLEDQKINRILQKEFQCITHSQQVTHSQQKSPFPTKDKYDENEAIGKIQEKLLLHKFEGKTDGYWKDLEVADTKVMVLSIPNSTYIRNANNPKEELSAKDVNGKFLILDGLVYKSNTADSSIVYMEV